MLASRREQPLHLSGAPGCQDSLLHQYSSVLTVGWWAEAWVVNPSRSELRPLPGSGKTKEPPQRRLRVPSFPTQGPVGWRPCCACMCTVFLLS